MADVLDAPGYEEWYRDVPRSVKRHAIFGLSLMVATFGGFGAWAFIAPLAAAVIAQGTFVATGQNKVVQHLEGGIIEHIVVREGDRVHAGQVLLRLDVTAAAANERELLLRQYRLEATEARLLAEYAEAETVRFPEALEISAAEDFEVQSILDSQKLAFNTSRRSLGQDVSLLTRSRDALELRRVGYRTQLASHREQVEILSEELAAKSQLLASGLVRKPEVLAVRRVIVEAEGQIGRLEAEINEIAEMQRRYGVQVEKARSEYREAALDELQPIQAELESVREKMRKAENVRVRSEVVAPVDGTVIRMHYHSPGGVVESGKTILEILPSDVPLIVEVQIPRTEIDSVSVGQHAAVRLIALNQRTTPVLDGEVFYVSADAIAEQVDGQPHEVYVARISLSPDQLKRIPGFTPTPGMPAEIMIQTAERTFAQYIAKPIADSMSRAFREQ
jgi:HlyD family type I secretion membrane fusion protein